VNRARHWLEAERLQALGIDRINHLLTLEQSRGLRQGPVMAFEETVAKLYFRAAQISASLAQAGPGLDAEVTAIQKERPPMPPPPPRPMLVRDQAAGRAPNLPLMCRCTIQGGPDGNVHTYTLDCKGVV
jgi:hypothetical protein